jgi:hypothetical protein
MMIRYERGLSALKDALPEEELEQFDELAGRLKDIIEREERFGRNPLTTSELNEVISLLNRLARKYCGVSFTDLCENPQNLQSGKSGRNQGQPYQPPPPNISYQLLTNIMPTTYCYNLRAEDFPFVTVTLDNTVLGSIDSSLLVSVVIENYSDTTATTVKASAQQQIGASFLPRITPTAMAALHTTKPATLHIVVEQTSPRQVKLYDQTIDIRLHARNTALLAVASQDGVVRDFTNYLAAWVTPQHPEIRKLLLKAKNYYNGQAFIGYPAAISSLEKAKEVVQKQVQAIFEAVKQDTHLTYMPLFSLPDDNASGQITQSVQFPGEILAEGGAANCLDGAVLFASLLEALNLQPLIVLIPQHAIVGWRIWRNVDQFEFLETTMIEDNDFQDAQKAAQIIFEKAQILGNHRRELFDPEGFVRIIDIAACRAKGINPLPFR